MKIVELADRKLAVVPVFAEKSKDDSCVLVFLHEALGSIGQWKAFPQQLCNALQLNGIVYEREGYGNSSEMCETRGIDYLHKYAWEELPELIKVLFPPEKQIILVGHSDGGTIALLYAARYPNKVKALVSMAAHVIVEDVTLKGIAPAVTAYNEGKLKGLEKYHGDKTEKLFFAWTKTWNLPEFFEWNICEDISTIICPVLAIQGINDQYGTEKQVDLIVSAIGNNKVQKAMLQKCGHHPHLEVGEEVIQLIVRFLDERC